MGIIHTDGKHIAEWERYRFIDVGNGQHAIQTYNGNYLTAVGGGGKLDDAIHTDVTHIAEWEKFRFIDIGNGQHAIQTCNGYFLTANLGGGLPKHKPEPPKSDADG